MKLESWLGMLGALLAALSLRLRKWLKRPQKLSVNYQVGNGTSNHLKITSSLNQDLEKDD